MWLNNLRQVSDILLDNWCLVYMLYLKNTWEIKLQQILTGASFINSFGFISIEMLHNYLTKWKHSHWQWNVTLDFEALCNWLLNKRI